MDLNIPIPMVTLTMNDINIPSSKPAMVGMDGSQTQFRQSIKCTVSCNNMKRLTMKHERDVQILVLKIVEYFSPWVFLPDLIQGEVMSLTVT